MRRIVGKAISWCLRDDIQEAAGPLQVSAGLKGGAEAAIHAMKEIYELETTDAVILVDAANAFNRLNRAVALHNVQYICPTFATVLINTYRTPARLFITSGAVLTIRSLFIGLVPNRDFLWKIGQKWSLFGPLI